MHTDREMDAAILIGFPWQLQTHLERDSVDLTRKVKPKSSSFSQIQN
jgi:hypothetical protein